MLTEQEYTEAAERYLDMVYRIALNWFRHPPDAEDAAQEVMLRLWRTDTAFQNEEHLRHWLVKVTVNECKRISLRPWRTRTAALEDCDGPVFEDREKQELYEAVIVLAGTALAVEHLGHVTILPMDLVPTGAKVNYAPAIIYGNCERIPLESLSDKVRAYAADMCDGVFTADIEFATLSECESFLGLELADNPLLEQQPWYEDGNPVPSTVSIFSRYQTPSELTVSSFYEVNGRRLNEFILLRTERAPEDDNYSMTSRWTPDEYEDYVTRSGMEVKIIAEEGEFGPGMSTCWAYFTRNNAIFSLTFSKENGDLDAMLDTMKEVLEAYE